MNSSEKLIDSIINLIDAPDVKKKYKDLSLLLKQAGRTYESECIDKFIEEENANNMHTFK